jgi:hypothetical protein
MNQQMINFLQDLVYLYQEKYKETLSAQIGESEKDMLFRLGSRFAYYDCLDILESQLKIFDVKVEKIGTITPRIW